MRNSIPIISSIGYIKYKNDFIKIHSCNINQIFSNKILIKELGKNNKSVFAKEKIEKDEILMQISSENVYSVKNKKIAEMCKANNVKPDDFNSLLFFLLNNEIPYNEYTLDFFKGYPLFWKDKEILKNSIFQRNLNKLKNEIKELYKNFQNHPYDRFLTMYMMIMSRSFSLDIDDKSFYAMAPIADMFNTNLETNCYWFFDEEYNLYINAGRDIDIDEELLINYNEGYNSYYLLYYGFTLGRMGKIADIEDFEIKINDKAFYLTLKSPPSLKKFKLEEICKETRLSDREVLKVIRKQLNDFVSKYPIGLEVDIVIYIA